MLFSALRFPTRLKETDDGQLDPWPDRFAAVRRKTLHWLRVITLRPAFTGGKPMLVFYWRQWRYSARRALGL